MKRVGVRTGVYLGLKGEWFVGRWMNFRAFLLGGSGNTRNISVVIHRVGNLMVSESEVWDARHVEVV